MNIEILNQYNIEFEMIEDSIPNIKQTVVSEINFCISSYLSLQPYVNYLTYEVIVEINKALNNQSFDADAGGENVFLKIGNPNSIFTYSSSNTNHVLISTSDLKEIILSWIDFLISNGIAK